MIYRTITLNKERNVTLTCYQLDRSKEMENTAVRPAILVLPGGGYSMCSDREAEPIAMAYLAEGYHAFVLRYSIGEHHSWPNPLNDAEQALGLIHEHADEWNIDPERIAVIGFSAGGHLAAALSTIGKVKPDAAILGYPVILTPLSQQMAPDIPGLEGKVTAETPPVFIFATANDTLVPPANALQIASDLDKQEISFEIHIFQNGLHGLSLAKAHTSAGHRELYNPAVAAWFDMSVTWLQEIFGEYAHDTPMPR